MRSSSALAVLFALAVAVPSVAQESRTAEVPVETPAVATKTAQPTPAPARPASLRPSPLALALEAIVEKEKAAMTKLKARLATASDAASKQAIHREIEQLKLDSEVEMLATQAADHRKNGRIAVAEQLELEIRELKAPQRMLEPAARPAPVVPSASDAR